jgi:hypothetical protein
MSSTFADALEDGMQELRESLIERLERRLRWLNESDQGQSPQFAEGRRSECRFLLDELREGAESEDG